MLSGRLAAGGLLWLANSFRLFFVRLAAELRELGVRSAISG